MNWTATHTNLRKELAELYKDKASAQRIADEAGLDTTNVTFSDNAANNWHEIITRADNQHLLIPLTERAIGENTRNETLKQTLGCSKRNRQAQTIPLKRQSFCNAL